jgi:DNA-binding Xre family transcriptional regulator
MPVRLRLPELLKEHEMTAYQVSKRSGWRISISTIYRLVAKKGRVKNFNAELLEDLCVVFGFDNVGKLLEVEGPRSRKRHGPHG